LNNLLAGLLKIGWSYLVVFSGLQAGLRWLKKKKARWFEKKDISPQTFDELEQRHVENIYGRHKRKSMQKAKDQAKKIEEKKKEEAMLAVV